jgi:hypothetical protein
MGSGNRQAKPAGVAEKKHEKVKVLVDNAWGSGILLGGCVGHSLCLRERDKKFTVDTGLGLFVEASLERVQGE